MLCRARMLEWPRLVNAYHRARRGKRRVPGVAEWFTDWETRLLRLRDRLAQGWIFGPYRSFLIRDPKERRVAAAPLEDRIVHHALVSLLGPLLE
ncbi:MAG: hypothetical protein JW940_37820 [Polyangiaceae bacterium]|nr:hypothetical protein [Polyangiaceae bacterium]